MKVFKKTGLAIFLKIFARGPVMAFFTHLNRFSVTAPMPCTENVSGLLVDQSHLGAGGLGFIRDGVRESDDRSIAIL